MSSIASAGITAERDKLAAYCSRHGVRPDAALAELVVMALSLPPEVVDYLREAAADRKERAKR